MICFAQPIDGGPVKIGYSADVPARIRQLESHYGRPMAILATMDGDRAEEAELHARFAHLRFRRTEQFRPGPELMAFINRPLFVNQGDVELMPVEAKGQVSVITLKGTDTYREWLAGESKRTHIPAASIVRLGLALWASQNGGKKPPEK